MQHNDNNVYNISINITLCIYNYLIYTILIFVTIHFNLIKDLHVIYVLLSIKI